SVLAPDSRAARRRASPIRLELGGYAPRSARPGAVRHRRRFHRAIAAPVVGPRAIHRAVGRAPRPHLPCVHPLAAQRSESDRSLPYRLSALPLLLEDDRLLSARLFADR